MYKCFAVPLNRFSLSEPHCFGTAAAQCRERVDHSLKHVDFRNTEIVYGNTELGTQIDDFSIGCFNCEPTAFFRYHGPPPTAHQQATRRADDKFGRAK